MLPEGPRREPAQVRVKFDPENVFHLNQNIKPGTPKFSTFHDSTS